MTVGTGAPRAMCVVAALAALPCASGIAACSCAVSTGTRTDAALDGHRGADGAMDGGTDGAALACWQWARVLAVDSGTRADSGPDDSGLDASAGSADSSRSVDPTLTVLDPRPCADWAPIVDRRPRRLPPDPTPRQLWRWYAYDDPVYRRTGLINQYIGQGVSIGPDGHLYAVGPEDMRLMSLTRQGRLRWISEPTYELLIGPPAMAPDGTAYVVSVSHEAFGPSWPHVLGFSPEGVQTVTIGDLGPTDSPLVPHVALGPGGRVYVSSPTGEVMAHCADGRRRWVLDLRGSTGRSAVPITGMTVMPDGSLWVYGDFDRVPHLAPDGTVLESVRSEGGASYGVAGPQTNGCHFLFTAYEPGPPRRHWAFFLDDGVPGFGFPGSTTFEGYRLDPVGGVWLNTHQVTPPPRYSRVVDGVEQWRVVGALFDWLEFSWGSDASMITRERGGLRRVLPTGEVAWSTPLVGLPGTESTGALSTGYAITLDRDGVAYVRAGQGLGNNYIIAVQTDVLPPYRAVCGFNGCGSRRNHWFDSP